MESLLGILSELIAFYFVVFFLDVFFLAIKLRCSCGGVQERADVMIDSRLFVFL